MNDICEFINKLSQQQLDNEVKFQGFDKILTVQKDNNDTQRDKFENIAKRLKE